MSGCRGNEIDSLAVLEKLLLLDNTDMQKVVSAMERMVVLLLEVHFPQFWRSKEVSLSIFRLQREKMILRFFTLSYFALTNIIL